MSETLYYILLGVIQGATEFLPVSSSGHLVVVQKIFDYEKTGILLDVSLHFGSLLAIFVVFRSELWRICKDTLHGLSLTLRRSAPEQIKREAPLFLVGAAVIVATIPAGVTGIFLRDTIRGFFQSDLPVTGTFLMLTGLVLLASRFAPRGEVEDVHPARGLLVGAAQVFALLPGVSRSGTTIVAGCFLGIRRDAAARFSFLLAVPAIGGAMIMECFAITQSPSEYHSLNASRVTALMLGTLTAAVVGWVCLKYLLRIVQRGQLHWFAAYCMPLGILLILAGLL